MNRKNLERLGRHGASVTLQDSHMAIVTARRRAMGFGLPPTWEESDRFTLETAGLNDPDRLEFEETNPAGLHVSRLLITMARLDKATHSIEGDTRLTAAGRLERLMEPRAAAAKALATHAAAVRTHAAQVADQVTRHYAPPHIEPGDAAAAIGDMEIRQHWRALSMAEQLQAAIHMTERPDSYRMLLALQRSPADFGSHSEVIKHQTAAWQAAIMRRDPDGTAAIVSARANAEWATEVTDAIRSYLEPVIGERHQLYAAVRDIVGGAEYVGIQPGMIPVLESRFQQQQAAS